MRRWRIGPPSKDPVKVAAELILIEQGFTRDEALFGMRFYRDGLKFTRQHIRLMVSCAKDHIRFLRDDMRIGTDLYQGEGYFWNHKYRFWMRGDAHGNGYKGISIAKARRAIHQRFLDERLELNGETQRHDEIINEVFGMNEYQQGVSDGVAVLSHD